MPNRPSIRQLSVLSLAVNLALAGSALALTAAKKCEIDKINAAKRREICLARHQKKEVKGKTPDFAGCERRF